MKITKQLLEILIKEELSQINEMYDADTAARRAIQITRNQADIQMLKQAIEALGGTVYLSDE